MHLPFLLLGSCLSAIAPRRVAALFEERFISLDSDISGLDITNPTIVTDEGDHTGVHLAVGSLTYDFERVTGTRATASNSSDISSAGSTIFVGTIERSSLIQQFIDGGILDVSSIEGKWESFVVAVVNTPQAGEALVIAGSDKRGAIYGVYTLSEQIGVSPWYWWADVVPKLHTKLTALPIQLTYGEPSVKYRGIFINDEAPSLTSWVLEKFDAQYNSVFYAKIFELLLRLKANYLWPAMWPAYPEPGDSFFVDDPMNQRLADDYGIVVSTSHHEPMQRSMNEWIVSGNGSWDWSANGENITHYFEDGAQRAKGFESYLTMGMRGEGDVVLVGDDPLEIMTEVLATQRSAIASTYGNETGEKQVLALYKEVQGVYEAGLEVPDDVTLLFSDDNFGNVRRFPTEQELQRTGGIGLYYHLEFVGPPRAYKWVNTNSLGKVQQQLSAAYSRGVDRIWVINSADLKPMETPLSMIFEMAWNISSVTASSIPSFLQTYAAREFPDDFSGEIAQLLLGHSRLVGLKRHESLEPSTLSILNYNEAQRVLNKWQDLLTRAETLSGELDEQYRPSFFQLVLHPIKASYVYLSVQVARAQNALFGTQRRTSTNGMLEHVYELLDADFDLQGEYHTILDGKWNHLMRQPHFNDYHGAQFFETPIRDAVSGLFWVQLRQNSSPAVGQVGVGVEGTPGVRTGLWNEGSDLSKPIRKDLIPGVTLPQMDPYGPSSRWFDVYGRGTIDIDWEAHPGESWISLSPTQGQLTSESGWDMRVEVTVDWAQVPNAFNETVLIHVNGTDGYYEQIHLPILNSQIDQGSFVGYVEGDRHVVMDAAHYARSSDVSDGELHYEIFPYLSRTLDGPGAIGLMPHRVNATPAIPNGPWLEYSYYQFTGTSVVNVTLFFTTALDTDPSSPLTFALSLDGSTPNATRLMPEPAVVGDLPDGWDTAVLDNIWRKSILFETPDGGIGAHQLRYWASAPNILLETVIVDMGGLRESFLSPQESKKVGGPAMRGRQPRYDFVVLNELF